MVCEAEMHSNNHLQYLSSDNAFDMVMAVHYYKVPQSKRPEDYICALHRERFLNCCGACVDVRSQIQHFLQDWIVASWHAVHASALCFAYNASAVGIVHICGIARDAGAL